MVWDTVEKPAVTSLLVNVATTSGISAVVYELAMSMVDGLAASKPPSQVVVETRAAGIPVPVAFLFPVRSVLPELFLLLELPVRVT